MGAEACVAVPRSAEQVGVGPECHRRNYGAVIALYRNREGL